MKILKLPKTNFKLFMEGLQNYGEVHVPKKKSSQSFVFGPMENTSEIAMDYLRTINPPKKYFFKPKDTLFNFSSTKGFTEVIEDSDKKIVLFGLHPCDIHGLKILDIVFGTNYPDKYYFARRKNVIVIGLSCMPDDKCFCRSMATDATEDGFDLFLSELKSSYLLTVGSSIGDDISTDLKHLLTEVTKKDTNEYLKIRKERKNRFTLSLDTSDLPYILELQRESEVWEELGKKCLCCGSCSMVCPTCSCFNVYDIKNLITDSGQRVRQWDSCLFKDYAVVAGGHNFRVNRADRVRNRYYDKQNGFVSQYGKPSCTGCGRCIQYCPTKIHVVEVFNKVRGEA
ncbi:MAG: 4Fe-4S dicluster domain-containing protein [Bacteroidota bacterium]|nr:4Fe-4S dicluster domain-containing protein [Bacteroidota bacterium]